MKSVQDIIYDVRTYGYECTAEVDGAYLRYDFYSTDMREAQDNYYLILEDLAAMGLEIDEPYIEHDCITGIVIESIDFMMTEHIDDLIDF